MSLKYTFTPFTYLLSLLQLILSPANGWEDIADDSQDSSAALTRGLLPLATVYAASAFLQMVYHPDVSLTDVIKDAVLDFAVITVGYYIALLVITGVAPMICFRPSDEDEAYDSDNRLRLLANYGMGLLAVSGIIINCMPGRFAVMAFLPLYVAIILWRGVDFIDVRPGQVERYIIFAIPAVIVPWALASLFL